LQLVAGPAEDALQAGKRTEAAELAVFIAGCLRDYRLTLNVCVQPVDGFEVSRRAALEKGAAVQRPGRFQLVGLGVKGRDWIEGDHDHDPGPGREPGIA